MEIQNVTYLAAELTRANPSKGSHVCAAVATELCKLGGRYFRLSEKLCGGEEQWGRYPEAAKRIARAEKARERLLGQALGLLVECSLNGDIEPRDLGFGIATPGSFTLCR